MTSGSSGNAADVWELQTPDGMHRYRMRVDTESNPPALVCTLGVDSFSFRLECVADLHQMLSDTGGWVELGIKDEKGVPMEGSVEA